jgi:hypothetical protein
MIHHRGLDKMNLSNITKAQLLNSIVICISLFSISNVGLAKSNAPQVPSNQLWEVKSGDSIQRGNLNNNDNKNFPTAEFYLNVNLLKEQLENSLLTAKESSSTDFILDIPLVDGTITAFVLSQSDVLPLALAKKYPSIKTYSGYQRDNPANKGKFDITPHGFHGMFKYNDNKIFIDPISVTKNADSEIPHFYRVYDAKNFIPVKVNEKFNEQVLNDKGELKTQVNHNQKPVTSGLEFGENLTNYRIAISATGEYTQYHGGTVELGLAEITTAINRINQVFEVDLAIRFSLAEDSDLIIFTDPEIDPFENNASVDIGNNRTILNTIIGLENYDIGHLFMVGGGGRAWLAVVCSDNKVGGATGLTNPINDAFYIDYVSHEIGHQFGSLHSFNGGLHSCSNRTELTAYEPGSGSTIMSYAGLCGEQKLQTDSDAYFHQSSILQIKDYLETASGSSCGTVISTNNSIPFIEAGNSFTIPAQTPFILTGNGDDSDGANSLTYTWEQFDLGPQTFSVAEMIDDGQRPLLRSYIPSPSPVRYLPNLSDLMNNTVSIGEVLPTTNRTMNFKLGVRDGRGGFNSDSTMVTVDTAAGPFQVLTPDLPSEQLGGESLDILWDVANTNASNVNCSHVDISISLDDTYNFEYTLIANTPNDGSEGVTLPNVDTAKSRVKVQCTDNRFFNISPFDFSIREYGIPTITGQKNIETLEDVAVEILLNHLTIDDENSSFPDDFTLNIESGDNYIVDETMVTPIENFNGELNINISISDDRWTSESFLLNVTVLPVNDAPIIDSFNDELLTDEDTAFELKLTDLSIIDVDSDTFTLVINSGENYSVSANNITPNVNYNGVLNIQVAVSDDDLKSDFINVTLLVNAVNDLPVALADSFTLVQDSFDNSLAVLNNDSDVDGDNLIISAINYNGSGTLTISNDQKNLFYSPSTNFSGNDSFAYSIIDQANGTSSSRVVINVTSNKTNSGGTFGFIILIYMMFLFSVKFRNRFYK